MSIDFDPVKVRRARRRADPLTIGVLAVVIALAVALVKPWQPGSVSGSSPLAVAIAGASPTLGPPSTPIAKARLVQRDPMHGTPPPTWGLLAPAIATHDTWGVRVIIVSWRGYQPDPRSPLYVERWSRTTPTPLGFESVYVARDSRSILALGLTFPPGSMPNAAVLWRVHANGELQSIDTRPLGPTGTDGAFLYVRSDLSGARLVEWDAGHYQIDVLVNGVIQRIAVQVPEPSGKVPPPDAWPIS